MDKIPEYANDTVYCQLVELCEMAGFSIQYTNEMSDDIIAETDEYIPVIHMPSDDIFNSAEQATAILGHELSHHINGDWYVNSKYHNPDNDYFLYRTIETDCDRIGVALAKLAELIAGNKAELRIRAGE